MRATIAILVGVFTAAGVTTAAADFAFDRHEAVIGSAQRQTVLTGFLLGGAVAELAVVSVDENDDRRLRIYAFGDGVWAPRLDATLRPEVSFVDVADIDGRDRLITYGHGRLNWFDPESATERELVRVTSTFKPPRKGEVLHVDVTRDVNGDGRDDLVVPHFHGFRVFIQMEDGAFADGVKLGPSAGIGRVYGADGYRYDPWGEGGRVHEMDYDRDGRGDLAVWHQDHFDVHRQDERGLFAGVDETFTTEVAFDSDQLASLAAPEEARRRRGNRGLTGDLTGRVLHSLSDVNGDGIADLAVFSLEGGSLWRLRSTYEVHFGSPAPGGGTRFAPDVGTAIRSEGIPFGMKRHGLDLDGEVGMMFTVINPGIFKAIGMIVRALLTDSVSLDVEFYRTQGGRYPERPNTTRKIKAQTPGVSGERAAFFPAVLIGDVNGDRRSDLLVQHGREELRVFLGVPGPDLFARRPLEVAVAMPGDEEYTWLVDLNRDGKQDVLVHRPSDSGPHRVTMLIAR